MRKKLFGKLLSVALSATMAVTSAVPAYAADSLALSETEADAEEAAEDVTDASEPETESEEKAENGEGEEAEPEEVQDEEAPKEEETTKEVTEETVEEVAAEEVAELTEEEAQDEELAELDSINDTTFTFVYNDTHIYAYDPLSANQTTEINDTITWDSTQPVTFELRPETGYVFDDISQISATYTYTGIEDEDNPVDMDNTNYSVTVDEETQVGKLYIPSSFMSSVKKKSDDGKLGITVTVGQKDGVTVTPVTKAATFYAKVDHDTINIGEKNAQLLLTYAKDSDAVIDFTGYEYSYFPITDVELYVGEVKPENKKNEADSDEHKYGASYPFKYDAAKQELTILEALVNNAYADGDDITIIGLSNAFTVEQDSTNKKTYGSTLAFAQGTVDGKAEITGGRSIDYENHIIVTATNPTGNKGRQLEKVEYTLTYKDGTTKTNTAEAENGNAEIEASEFGDETNPLRKIVAKGYYTDVIQYKTGASYTVESSEDGAISEEIQQGEDQATAIGEADAAFRYETKKDAVIYVKPTGQNTVTKVEYTIGTGTTKKELTPDESGKCTIPADDMTNVICLYVTTEEDSNLKVKVSANVIGDAVLTTDFVVTKYGTATNINPFDSAERIAEAGKSFSFTVREVSHDYKVKSVTYLRNESQYDADENPGTVITPDSKGIYTIDSLEGEQSLELYITTTSMVEVQIPDNPKAVVYVNSVAQTKDFFIEKDKAFTFEVKGRADSNDGKVTIKSVSYTVADGTPITDAATDTEPVAGKYTIGKSVVETVAANKAIVISADTAEEAKAGTYSVKFEPDENSVWAGEWKAGKEGENDYYSNRNINPSESLFVARTDETVLTPSITYTKATNATTYSQNTYFDPQSIKYEQVSKLEGIARIAIVSEEETEESEGTGNLDVYGNQVGKESVKYTFTSKDVYGSGEFNYVTISGTLNVEVKPHFEITLAEANEKTIINVSKNVKNATNSDAKAGAAAEEDTDCAWVVATILDNVTREPYTEAINQYDITWTASSAPWYVFPTQNTEGDGNFTLAKVVAGAAAAEKKFNIAVKDGKDANNKDIVFTAATPVSLEAADVEEIGVVAVVDITNGAKTWTENNLVNETPSGANNSVSLDAAVLNNATITYKAYKVETKGDSWANYRTEEEIANGLEDELLTDITSKVTFDMEYYAKGSNPHEKEAGLKITGSKGTYTAVASAKTTANVMLDVTCTYNKATYFVPEIEFVVNRSVATVDMPLIMEEDAEVANPITTAAMKLGKGYLTGKTYFVGYNEDHSENGYLFKVTPGSQFTLPTEADLDESVYKGTAKKKALVAWKVTPSVANAIRGYDSTAAITCMPGSTAIVDAAITSLVPVWADRYELGTAYRNPSTETKDYVLYTNVLADDKFSVNAQTETVKVPATVTELTNPTTIPVGGEFEIGVPVTAAIPYADGKYANTEEDIVTENTLYPATSGKIVWHAYDNAGEIALPGGNATEKATLKAGSEYVSFDGNSIKGVKSNNGETKTWIYATYTGDDGNEYTLGSHIEIAVDGEPATYSIDASKLLEVTDKDGNKSNSIELGQTVKTKSVTLTSGNGLVIKEDELVAEATKRDPAKGAKLIWTYDKTALEITDGQSDLSLPVIRALKQGKTTVKVQYVDANGAKSNEASVTITVTEPSVKIVWTDKTGKTVASPSAEVQMAGAETNLYFRLLDKENNDITIDSTVDGNGVRFVSKDPEIIKKNKSLGSTNNIYQLVGDEYDIDGKNNDDDTYKLGSTTVTVYVTTGGSTYSKEIAIRNYSEIRFDLSEAKMAANDAYNYPVTQYDDIADLTNPDKTVLGGVGGELITTGEGKGDYVVKVYEDNLATNGSYTVDLTKFTATYSGTYKDKITFAGAVFGTDQTKVPNMESSHKIPSVTEISYVLSPQFEDAKLTSVVTSVDSVAFDNLDATKTEANVEVSVKPVTTAARISIKSSTSNKGVIDAFFKIQDMYDGIDNENDNPEDNEPDGEPDAEAASGDEFDLVIENGKGSFNIYPIVGKVGETILTVTAPGNEVKDTVDLKVYGIYTDSTGKDRYVNVNGEDAIDTAITYNKSKTTKAKLFFDADGYLITTAGAAHDENGNLVLLAANAEGSTLVTSDGLHVEADANKNDFYTLYGLIQTGEVVVKGVNRYADTGTGALVTYAMTKTQGVEGKWTDTKNGLTYVIDKDTNEAVLDDIRYNPVVTFSEWPATYTKGAADPVITYTVKYWSKNANKLIEDDKTVYTAKVTKDDSVATKVTFTATTDLTGFFADSEGKTKATDVTDTKSYFFDKSGEAIPASEVGEGIIIVGLDDEYQYTGVAIKPAFIVQDLSNPKEVLALGVDYTVTYKDNKGSATQKVTASVTVKGKGNYTGQSKTAYFDIVPVEVPDEALSLAGAKLTLPSGVTYYYNGEAQYPETFEIKYKGESTPTKYTGDGSGNYSTEDGERPVAVSFSNNVNKGSATILVTGASVKGKATTLKKTFSIKAATLSKVSVTVETDNSWAVKGATPSVAAVWTDEKTGNTIDLVEGQDFKVTYANNKKVNTSAAVKLTGKGNFTGSVAGQEDEVFGVSKLDLADTSKVTLVAATVAVGTKASSVKVTVLDEHGDVIPASRYTVEVEKDGSKLDGKTPLTAGAVTVKAVAKAGSDVLVEGSVAENDFNVAALNLSKASVKVNGSMTYTGEELRPDNDWFNENVVVTIKNGKTPVTLKAGEDFTVTGYTNNIKKGTMKVTIVGLGDDNTDAKVAVSGTKTVNVKIVARSLAN